jgi:hypothetical protein
MIRRMDVLDSRSPPPPIHSPSRVLVARGVAVLADLIQIAALPVTAAGALSPIDDGIDIVTAAVLTLLVGPHLAFVPSFLVKMLPVADLAPTWTIAVLIATGGRRAEPLAPVPMLSASDPGGRQIGRSARTRAVVWFAVVFVIGFAVGGLYLMPHLPRLSGVGYWRQNWAGALLGGVLGLLAARTVLQRAGRI